MREGHKQLIILETISDPARLPLAASGPRPYRARREATAGSGWGEAEAAAGGCQFPSALRASTAVVLSALEAGGPCGVGQRLALKPRGCCLLDRSDPELSITLVKVCFPFIWFLKIYKC